MRSSGSSPRRIFGPARSTRIAIGSPSSLAQRADVVDVLLLHVRLAVGHVQAKHVDAGMDQLGQHFGLEEAGPTVATIFVRVRWRGSWDDSIVGSIGKSRKVACGSNVPVAILWLSRR